MHEVEITNYTTGEIETLETSVDIQLISDYNNWVMEHRLNPQELNPQLYAKEIEDRANREIVKKAIEFVEFYNKETSWPIGLVRDLLRILRNEERSDGV